MEYVLIMLIVKCSFTRFFSLHSRFGAEIHDFENNSWESLENSLNCPITAIHSQNSSLARINLTQAYGIFYSNLQVLQYCCLRSLCLRVFVLFHHCRLCTLCSFRLNFKVFRVIIVKDKKSSSRINMIDEIFSFLRSDQILWCSAFVDIVINETVKVR